MATENSKSVFGISLDQDLSAKIRKLAEDERRSVSAQICIILEQYFEKK